MRKNLINYIAGFALILVMITSCDQASQEASPIVEPDDSYPVATFTTNFSGNTVTEGDTIMYTINLNKTIDRPITFDAIVTDGTVNSNDYVAQSVTVPAYYTEATMYIIFIADDFPEESETINIELGITNQAEKYLVHPSTTYPALDLTVNNYNDPEALTIAYGWDTENDDIDLLGVYEESVPYYAPVGTLLSWLAAASSDNPEIAKISTDVSLDSDNLPNADPVGTYYIGIDPYHVEGSSFNFTISIGHPDQTNEYFTGTFDMTATGDYVTDPFTAWDMIIYRMLKVVSNGDDTFTVSYVFE